MKKQSWETGLEGTEADAAGLFCADFHVAQNIGGDDHQAAFVVRQPQFAALGDRVANYLGDGFGVLRRFEDNFAANVLNTNLYFHSKASQPINVQKMSKVNL